ncbi:MAG: glutaredoxin family protein, partial [Terriglobia bacterium]
EGGESMGRKRIRMYTRAGCEDSDAARKFLKQNKIPFEELDIDQSRKALQFVESVNEGKQRTPTFDVGGRTFHCSHFDPQKLARELALAVTAQSSDR